MLRWFRADLHIHTCLSPCGDLTMSPLRVVKMACEKEIDIIGICDHNSAENVKAAINAAELIGKERTHSLPLAILPGMEVCTKEEVHIIGLFRRLEDVLKMQELVYQTLPAEKNNPELFGEQIIANEFDEVEGYNERLLIGASNLSVKEVVDHIHNFNGIAIASHIDREAYSLIGQLGFIPEDLSLDAIEISHNITIEDAYGKFPEIKKYSVIRSSDAHFLEDIGKATTKFFIAEPTIEEIKMALRNEKERKTQLL
ncbi:MAG: PHP-associated domain-containing protein [candidate division WOR-3 bacterium]